MMTVVDIRKKMQELTPIVNRGEQTTEAEVTAAFSTLAKGDFLDAGVYLGTFTGNAGWERHMKGDELIQILTGSAEFDIIIDDERQTFALETGMLLVVPRGCWHRFRSIHGITLLTATPRFDETHTFVDDPRSLCVNG